MAIPRVVDVAETIRAFRSEPPGVDVHLLPAGLTPRISTPLTVVCPAGHRLAGVRNVDPADVVGGPIIDLARGWWARAPFDTRLQESRLRRRVRLEIDEWLALLNLVQRGMGISYGPVACTDRQTFAGVTTVTPAGAPLWELGVTTRDEPLRGAAGRAVLAACLDRCRPLTTGQGAAAVTTSRRTAPCSAGAGRRDRSGAAPVPLVKP